MAETPYIKPDRRLQAEGKAVAEKLCELRWHWTLDEDNPDRVSFAQYARDVGVYPSAINRDARTHIRVTNTPGVSIQEARHRERLGAETELAVEALAQAAGISFSAAAHSDRRPAVREIRARAEERATESDEPFDEVYAREVKTIATGLYTAAPAPEQPSKSLFQQYAKGIWEIIDLAERMKDEVPEPQDRDPMLRMTQTLRAFTNRIEAYLEAPEEFSWAEFDQERREWEEAIK